MNTIVPALRYSIPWQILIAVSPSLVIKLLSIYWKISLLFFISLLLLIGKYNYALVITNISTLLMTISVWFWNDINDELREYDFSYPLTTTTKIWRWTVTFISLNFLIQSLKNFNCVSFINSGACEIWLQPSTDFYIICSSIIRGAPITCFLATDFSSQKFLVKRFS